jgi:hypothetical protein
MFTRKVAPFHIIGTTFLRKCPKVISYVLTTAQDSVVEPEREPQGAGTFGRSRYTEVSAPAPAPGQTKLVRYFKS